MLNGVQFCLLSIIPLSFAYYHGAPCQALYSMFPNHDNILMQNSTLKHRYLLRVTNEKDKSIATTYKVGDTYRIRLSGTGFRGFLMQVRHIRENGRIDEVHRLGRFIEDETWEKQGIKLLSCSPVERADSITHSDNHRREAIEVLWRPATTDGDVQIIFTVVEEKERFWTNQMFPSGRLAPVVKKAPVVKSPVIPVGKKTSSEDTKNLRRKPPRLPLTRKPVTTREETPPKQKPTTPIVKTTAGPTPTTTRTAEVTENVKSRFHERRINVSSEEIIEATIGTKIRGLNNLTSAESSGENRTLIDLASNRDDTEEVKTTTTPKKTTAVPTTTKKVTTTEKTVTTTKITPTETTTNKVEARKPAVETGNLNNEDLLIERIFQEIRQIIVDESVRELNGSSSGKINIPKLAITVEKEGEKETRQLEYVLEKLARTEGILTETVQSSTTPSTTEEPTTTKLKASPKTTATVIEERTSPPKTTSTTKPTTQAKTTPEEATKPPTTSVKTTTTALKSTKTSQTTSKPPTKPSKGPVLAASSNSNTHPKCDADYWMECKDWSESECELIWVRQNCRKKCCDYLLRTLYN